MRLTREGDRWVARSLTAADGTLLLSFREDSIVQFQRWVSGTMSGSATSVLGEGGIPASGERLLLDGPGPATVQGSISPSGSLTTGSVLGPARFVDSTGTRVEACSSVSWMLQDLR